MENELVEGYRLSPQQRAAWRGGCGRAVSCRIEVTGPLEDQRLRDAIRQVIARHQILRTGFRTVSGLNYPLQQIHSDSSPELLEFAWEHHSPTQHTLRIAASPLCADPATLRLMAREIRAHCIGAAACEEALPYIQFAEWMNELSSDDGADAGRQFWLARTASVTPMVLPDERQEGGGSMCLSRVVEGRSLCRLAEQLQVPLSTVLMAALAVQFWRRTGESQTALYNLFPCRKYAELQEAIGPIARFLPVLMSMRPSLTFDELVRKIVADLQEIEAVEEYYGDESNEGGIGFEYREEEEGG
ncbi:MAG: condensation domain-containing protein, partial [Candidatus Solibacter sp.]